MTSATTKRPEDTSSRHLRLINYGERITLALGYPVLGPSRHVRAYILLHAIVVQS